MVGAILSWVGVILVSTDHVGPGLVISTAGVIIAIGGVGAMFYMQAAARRMFANPPPPAGPPANGKEGAHRPQG